MKVYESRKYCIEVGPYSGRKKFHVLPNKQILTFNICIYVIRDVIEGIGYKTVDRRPQMFGICGLPSPIFSVKLPHKLCLHAVCVLHPLRALSHCMAPWPTKVQLMSFYNNHTYQNLKKIVAKWKEWFKFDLLRF